MKMFVMLGLSTIVTLWSGCCTYEKLERRKAEAYKREYYLASLARTEALLQRDFDAVFSHPAFMNDDRDSDRMYGAEREALQNHLKRMRDGGPTPEQVARLIDWMKRQSELTVLLKYTWTSPHITMQQRIDYALWLDKNTPRCYSSNTLDLVLPCRLFSDEQYQALQKQCKPKGRIDYFITRKQEERCKFREKARQVLSELK